MERTLSKRALNRALLARQLLLERASITPQRAVERLAGLQAQQARPPFIGLWTRLDGFRREDLVDALDRRAIVKGTLMRHTLHLMSARDYRRLRMPVQAALTRAAKNQLRKLGLTPRQDEILDAARGLSAEHRDALVHEGEALLRFVEPDAPEHEVSFEAKT